MVQPVNTSGRIQLKRSCSTFFPLNWQHSASSPLTIPHLPYLWLIKLKKHSTPKSNIPNLTFLQATSYKLLVHKRRFWQNGPASQHVRKEPTKNKFLVNFCFELTAWNSFSSDLPLPPKSLVDKRRMIVCHCHCHRHCRWPPPQNQNLLLSCIIQVFGW